MRFVKRILLFAIILLSVYYFIFNPEMIQREQTELEQKELLLEKKQDMELSISRSLDIDLIKWIGKSASELTKTLGEPKRKDLSPYGYTTYIYLEEYTKYMVFGIENDDIVMAFTTGSDIQLGKLDIGQSYTDVDEELSFQTEINFRKGTSSYTLKLSDKDLISRPIAKVDNDLFIQCYFDTVTNTLSAIRLLNGETLLLQQAYELVYRGYLPDKEQPSNDEWEEIERGQEQQIFELTNILRNIYNYNELTWEDEVSKVAFSHSKDMENNDYFSHESLSGDGLSDRLAYRNIKYRLAGENIAANYPDALATVIGWLNSEGHRESLLNEQFTHLGVGVFRLYYTQNFLRK